MVNLRLAVRTLVKTPFVTLVAIVSLAFGIGANTAIFSLYEQILMRPLPVASPQDLVNLEGAEPNHGSQSCNQSGPCRVVLSYPMFRDLEKAQRSFTGIAAHRMFGANLAFRGQTMSSGGALVSGSYFPVLGIHPTIGRLLSPADDQTIGGHFVVVLGHRFWRTHLASDPKIIGESITVNGRAMTVIGVAPEGFKGTTFPSDPHIYVPLSMRGEVEPGWKGFDDRRSYWVYAFARLKPGVSIEQARTTENGPYRTIINQVEAPLQKGMSDTTLKRFRAKVLGVERGWRGQSNMHEGATAPIAILMGITAFVLLIACANIANLLLARAATRTGEMAVRLAMGGQRRHLMAQLLAESCLLALAGAVGGLLVSRWTLSFILWIVPPQASDFIEVGVSWPVVAFAAAITVGTGLIFGLVPALFSTRPNLVTMLQDSATRSSGSRGAAWFRVGLATGQITLSTLLLILAGLFTKSLMNVSRIDVGFRTERLVMFSLSPELNGYKPAQSLELFSRLESVLTTTPGVAGVATSMVPLLADSSWGIGVQVEGFQSGPDVDNGARFNQVGPGYFRTLGITMMAGREFTESDAVGRAKVAVVNEAFTRKFNLGRSAVGKRMRIGDPDGPLDIEIVGVARDTKYNTMKAPVTATCFRPYRQDGDLGFLTFYVRAAGSDQQVQAAIPGVVKRLDPNLPVEELRTMTTQIRENVFGDRLVTTLSTAFAVLATLLAAIGLYGVLAYTFALRTREIGLRMALGAAPGRVQGMVLRHVALMAGIGVPLGALAAWALGRAARSLLFELQPHDPVVFIVALTALTLVAFVAGIVPARRASQTDPVTALRCQ